MAAKKNTEKKQTEEKPKRTVKPSKKQETHSLSEFSISMLKDYYNVCENILKHYENEVYANKDNNVSAYKTAKENYDRYVKIHNLLFVEIEKRLSLIS